jgi:hypothetical protein
VYIVVGIKRPRFFAFVLFGSIPLPPPVSLHKQALPAVLEREKRHEKDEEGAVIAGGWGGRRGLEPKKMTKNVDPTGLIHKIFHFTVYAERCFRIRRKPFA